MPKLKEERRQPRLAALASKIARSLGAIQDRFKNRESVLFYSTLLAAFAAVASSVAAFRQEQAAFVSNLYSHQVTAVSNLEAANRRHLAAVGDLQFRGWNLAVNGIGNYNDLIPVMERVELTYVELDNADMQLCLLSGDDYTIFQDNLGQALYSSVSNSRAIFRAFSNSPGHTLDPGAFEKLRIQAIHTGMNGGEAAAIVACAHDYLKLGKPVPPGAFQKCDKRYRRARNEGRSWSEREKAPKVVKGWKC
ncbi:hypothetical protein GVN21_07300 [Caulobacter sp. SLTY]|uniref:hypothetical protein n=1 Tax=Caulobacter sp. SLTY TaxID=2683262 RepID=UPI001411BB0B|nr:hypothetical protein [Caulobacter sp. SLTY]NBB15160.1 hypothetical protein [Caulobacter sp. SLTY]